MQSKIKDALISTAAVLATIYALRKISVTRGIVDTALKG